MAQALFLAAVYAVFIIVDMTRMKKEKSGAKPVVIYVLLVAVCVTITMLFFFNVDLLDPQKSIVEFIKGMVPS